MDRGARHPFLRITSYVLVVFFVAALIGVGIVWYYSRSLPSIDDIATRRVAQSTKIYDRTGEVLLYELSGDQKRTAVPLEHIAQSAQDAVIAIEDEKFYEETYGIKAIARAFIANLTSGEIVQGGSTITRQLAKNAFLSPEQTISRKIKEFLLAVQIGKHYSKEHILGAYLNEIPYGSNIYGIEAASQAYFSKPAKELSVAESATLAAIIKAPTYYSPWGTRVQQLFARKDLVLKKMHELGKLDDSGLAAALREDVRFSRQVQSLKAAHFVIAAQEYLIEKYGEEFVRTAGLTVRTTLDWKLQELAEKVVAEGAKRNEELYGGTNAALVAQDAKTGQILALVGSRNYFDVEKDGNFNVATQGLRQPGSALKPFAYLSAFEQGYTPDTVVFDVPTEFAANRPECPARPDFSNENPKCFHPENFDQIFRGPVRLKEALAHSLNIPAVKVLYLAGLSNTLKLLQSFGVTTLTQPDRYGLSLVLGGGEVTLQQLVGAYSTLAQEGVKRPQTLILEIRDGKGGVLESYKNTEQRVLDSQGPRLINRILSDIELRRGLLQSSLSLTIFPDYDVALKTGTSNDYRDAWTVGYTPSFVVGVWAGNNDNTPMQRRGSSILAAIPIWSAFMKEALPNQSYETFNRPDEIIQTKPMLNGEYAKNNHIHSILYYIDRANPLGPFPQNPSEDSQFENWETTVIDWARTHVPNFDTTFNKGPYPQQETQGTDDASTPLVVIESPTSGSFIESPIPLRIRYAATNQVTSIRVYINKTLIREDRGLFPNTNTVSLPLTPRELRSQNELVVEVTDSSSRTGSTAVIVYR